MWKYHKLLGLDQKDLSEKANLAIETIDEFIEAEELYQEAFNLSCRIDQPTYDLMYLVLSRKRKANLLSLDKRLLESASHQGIDVIPITKK